MGTGILDPGCVFLVGLFFYTAIVTRGFKAMPPEVVVREAELSTRPKNANSTSERSPFRLRLTLQDSSAYSPFRDARRLFANARRVNCFAATISYLRTGSGSWPGEILENA
jgi:hypothetical protein